MEELVNIFLQNATESSNIQPYVLQSWFGSGFLSISIGLLLSIVFLLKYGGIRFFDVFFPFLASEHYALSFYKIKTRYSLLDIFLAIFFLLQLTFLLFHFIPKEHLPFENTWLQFGAIFLCVFLLSVVKLFIYQSIKHLLPSRVDVNYYGFNYAYWCFYFGTFLFLLNLLVLSGAIQLSLFILAGVFIAFYSFLIIRLISISLRYNILKSVYIFLYLCTLEIAPILIVVNVYRFL